MDRVHVIRNYQRPFSAFGFVLVGIGIFWLLKEMGYIPDSFPIWPLVLIVIGVTMILNRACLKCR